MLARLETSSINQMLQSICYAFLPGQYPTISEGPEAMSLEIEPSKHLQKSRAFSNALIDIKGISQ